MKELNQKRTSDSEQKIFDLWKCKSCLKINYNEFEFCNDCIYDSDPGVILSYLALVGISLLVISIIAALLNYKGI